MKFINTQKTPVADVLGGDRDEGLEYNPNKELNMHQSTLPTRLELDGFTTDVAPYEDRVHITISDEQRFVVMLGLSITRTEARRLASALLDASAPDFGSAPMEEIYEHTEVARKATVSMTPAKAAARMKAVR